MPLRALRLFTRHRVAELKPATSSSFFNLQIVASREWSRAHSQTRTPAQFAHKTTCEKKSMESSMAHTDIIEPSPDDAYFDPVLNDHEHLYFDPVLNNYEPTRMDFFSIEPWEKDRLKRMTPHYLSSYLTTVVNTEAFPPKSPLLLPIPKTHKQLYHNLINILRTRTSSRPTLAALLDYHLLFQAHHSTDSYNLLISLSIHHGAYGTTHKLFLTMQDRFIQYDTETHRLYVRWLICKGFWDRAWDYAMQLKNKFPDGSIPLPIWLEFCHTRSKGPIIEGTFNPKTKINKFKEPVSLFSARSNVMNTNRPPSIPALKDTPPAGIRNIVLLMVKSGLKRQALKLTGSYFRALSLTMDGRMNHRCLDIVKIHLAFNGRGKAPLPRFIEARTLFFSLMSLNPQLRPTSDTLMFILSTLKRARQSGTIAWKFISLCKEKWGPEVEDRQIRRRVSSWALKEGRIDIVETLLRAEAIENRARQPYLAELEVVGDLERPRDEFLDRPSVRRIYPSEGRETYMWHRLRLRVRRTMKKREAQGR